MIQDLITYFFGHGSFLQEGLSLFIVFVLITYFLGHGSFLQESLSLFVVFVLITYFISSSYLYVSAV